MIKLKTALSTSCLKGVFIKQLGLVVSRQEETLTRPLLKYEIPI
jgi:hypothetical protein